MDHKEKLQYQRRRLLIRIKNVVEAPMIILGFIWLVLVIIDLTAGLNPILDKISTLIWIIFLLHFALLFILAPVKKTFLKKNVLTAFSLLVPAIRVLRLARFIRLLRGVRLAKVLGSLNRGMRSLKFTMSKRGFGYMLLLTVIVELAGAAGMFAFERDQEGKIHSYPEALWWTAMMVLTVGSDYWPKSVEGRVLCYLIALYGFAILGYVTATLASFFVGRDAEENKEIAAETTEIKALKKEVLELKDMIREIADKLKNP